MNTATYQAPTPERDESYYFRWAVLMAMHEQCLCSDCAHKFQLNDDMPRSAFCRPCFEAIGVQLNVLVGREGTDN